MQGLNFDWLAPIGIRNMRSFTFLNTAAHFLLFPRQGKKGRPGEDGTPGAKGQKVSISVTLSDVCLLLLMYMGNMMRKPMAVNIAVYLSSNISF